MHQRGDKSAFSTPPPRLLTANGARIKNPEITGTAQLPRNHVCSRFTVLAPFAIRIWCLDRLGSGRVSSVGHRFSKFINRRLSFVVVDFYTRAGEVNFSVVDALQLANTFFNFGDT